MKLTSPEFEDGEFMPEKYGNTRENVNPPLEIENTPEEAESLVLIMDDPDAKEPAGKIWEHWTVWNIDPDTGEIEADSSPGVEGMTDFRQRGYGGPNPPDGVHLYYFKLYALDTELDLPEDSRKEDVEEALDGHVIEETELTCKFDRLS
jgi:Raf kinase inhibitor-like YbhB/YbcL family protein